MTRPVVEVVRNVWKSLDTHEVLPPPPLEVLEDMTRDELTAYGQVLKVATAESYRVMQEMRKEINEMGKLINQQMEASRRPPGAAAPKRPITRRRKKA